MTPLTPAQKALVEANLDVARKSASFYTSRFPWARPHADDIAQESMLGLMYAASKWREGAGASFRTFAYRATHFYVKHALRTMSRGGVSIPKEKRWDNVFLDQPDYKWERLATTDRAPDEEVEAKRLVGSLHTEFLQRVAFPASGQNTKNADLQLEGWLRVRYGQEEMQAVGKELGFNKQRLHQMLNRLDAVFEGWARDVRGELDNRPQTGRDTKEAA